MKKALLLLLTLTTFIFPSSSRAASYTQVGGTTLEAFVQNQDLQPPTKPKTLGPTNNFHSCDPVIVFSWEEANDASGIAHYTFTLEGKLKNSAGQISPTVDFNRQEQFTGATTTHSYKVWFENGVYYLQFEAPLPEGRYSWSVRATDNSGNQNDSTATDTLNFDYLPSTYCNSGNNCNTTKLTQVTLESPRGNLETLNPALVFTYPQDGQPSSIVYVEVDGVRILENISLQEQHHQDYAIHHDQENRRFTVQLNQPYLPDRGNNARYLITIRLKDGDGCTRDKQATITYNPTQPTTCTTQGLIPTLLTPPNNSSYTEPEDPDLTFTWDICTPATSITNATFVLNGTNLFVLNPTNLNTENYNLKVTNTGVGKCGNQVTHFELTLKKNSYQINGQTINITYNDPLNPQDWNRWSVRTLGCNGLTASSTTFRFRFLPGNLGTYFFCTAQDQCTSGTLADCLASGRNCYFGDQASCQQNAAADCGENPPIKSYHWCDTTATCTKGTLANCAQMGKNCYLNETDPAGNGNGCLDRAANECSNINAQYFWCSNDNMCQTGNLIECQQAGRYCYRKEPEQLACPDAGRLRCPTGAAVVVAPFVPQEQRNWIEWLSVNVFPFISLLFLLPLSLILLFFPKPVGLVFDVLTHQPVARAMVVAIREGKYLATSITNSWGLYQGFKMPQGEYHLLVSHEDYLFPSNTNRPQSKTQRSYYLGENFAVSNEYARTLVHEIPLDLQPTLESQKHQEQKKWWHHLPVLVRIINFLQALWGLGFLLALVFTIIRPVWFNILILALFLLGFIHRIIASHHRPNVTGKMINAFNQNARGAHVEIRLPQFANLVLATITDERGEFKFHLDDKRTYQLQTPGFVFTQEDGNKETIYLKFQAKTLSVSLVVIPKTS